MFTRANRIQIVEIRQPRCGLRYGVGPCTASGGPNCYNCLGTCQDLANYDQTGVIRWMFCKPDASIFPTYEVDGDDIRTNCIPLLSSVTASSSRINISGAREGESPVGTTATVTVECNDAPWDDRAGDFYPGTRPAIDQDDRPSFWQTFTARNPYIGYMEVVIYDGYEGQTLAQMDQRLFVAENVEAQGTDGATLTGNGPMQVLGDDDAYFPRTTDLQLYGGINASTTAVRIYGVNGADDLGDDFGNTALKYIRVGDEIMSYSSAAEQGTDTGIYLLSNVARGALGTDADSHDDEDAAQRVGRYDLAPFWEIENDLIVNHTRVKASYVDYAGWVSEGEENLFYYTIAGTVAEPTPVEDLVGEIVQQCEHYLWWDERAILLKMRAISPSQSPVAALTEDQNILRDSQSLTRDADAIYTRVYIHHDRVSQIGGLGSIKDFRQVESYIDGEAAQELGTTQELVIYSRWLRTNTQALLSTAALCLRYSRVQRYLRLSLNVKDDVENADLVTVNTRLIRTSEGARQVLPWQVIARTDTEPQSRYDLELQEFSYRGRYGVWAPEGLPDYDAATDEQKATYGYWADEDGKVDGDEGYRWA